jgi:hypothetical protein
MIEDAVYAKLATVLAATCDDRIYPSPGKENTQQPFAIYESELTESIWKNSGPTGTYSHSYQVEVFATTFDVVQTMAAAIITLDGWSAGTIHQCVLQSAKPIILEFGFGYTLIFKIWEVT